MQRTRHSLATCFTLSSVTSTAIGSVTFLLYHVVFCLAQAATIDLGMRHASNGSRTGLLAKTAAVGVLLSGPLFIQQLGHRANAANALYPASDLFLAPFLAHLAENIDQGLYDRGLENDDGVFFTTFAVALGSALFLSGVLCILAARVKLANLGAYLPYSVLCGFFSTIGILMWTLGFNVDTGQTIGYVVASKDWENTVKPSMYHHAPSLALGVVMHIIGQSNPFMVILFVMCSIPGAYVVMYVTGTNLEQAQDANWFFSARDLSRPMETNSTAHDGSPLYGPPSPFGILAALARNDVCWGAAKEGIPIIIALAFLYVIRSSLQAAAVKKNIPNVSRKPSDDESPRFHDIPEAGISRSIPRQEPPSLGFILEHGYGYSQILSAFAGGISVAPSLAASITLFKLGAEGQAPQYGSCLIVLLFYMNNFEWVEYIPKPTFSCLMVLAAIDMIRTWMVGSFLKTKSKTEWAVAPLLVIMTFAVGILNAIFLGVALSTFIFAAHFYMAGTVRFVGSGLTLRSTVERGVNESAWLNQNADKIQIVVLQHFLFFGNAQSVWLYISTMFEEGGDSGDAGLVQLPPIPVFIIVDFTMVSGIDTSAIDVFSEILALCKEKKCRLLLAGLGADLKASLVCAGIKPSTQGSFGFSYSTDLESALAKAEDGLVSTFFHIEDKDQMESSARAKKRSLSNVEDGFLYALRKIDEQHNLHTADELQEFQRHTVPITLEPGESLNIEERSGLYFVETGLMRIRHASGHSTLRMSSGAPAMSDPTVSLGHLNARTATIGRQQAVWKQDHSTSDYLLEPSSRLARIGQGWIIGGIEASLGARYPDSLHVAITSCRLHFLSMDAIHEAETSNPKLAMNLYKILSHLSTKRQEVTIRQLGQFLKIVNTPPPRLTGGRLALAKLHR